MENLKNQIGVVKKAWTSPSIEIISNSIIEGGPSKYLSEGQLYVRGPKIGQPAGQQPGMIS